VIYYPPYPPSLPNVFGYDDEHKSFTVWEWKTHLRLHLKNHNRETSLINGSICLKE